MFKKWLQTVTDSNPVVRRLRTTEKKYSNKAWFKTQTKKEVSEISDFFGHLKVKSLKNWIYKLLENREKSIVRTQEIELTIDSPFVTANLRPDRKSNLFKRAYARLAIEKKNPGMVNPIFSLIDNDYKIFGAFTLNGGGSVSFFPDFYKLDNFDHLTLNKDFIQKKGHLTMVESSGKHIKFVNLEASRLEGGNYYHLITFGMENTDLLMDASPQIELPPISYATEQERMKYHAWIDGSVQGGVCILEFPEGDGAFFVQILILPKGESNKGLAVVRGFVENLLAIPKSLEGRAFICKKIDIPTPEKSDFFYLYSYLSCR